ncbi:MAG: right-handed parallel beta-helix repeat-containing protein [Armatimonadota bacterium]
MSIADPLIIVALILALAIPCAGAQYYLAPDGSDDAAGSREQPWRTIDKANATLEAGDEVIFLPGEYPGAIAPANSGTAEAPIVFRSVEPLAATLKAGEGINAIYLRDRSHVVVEGFRIDPDGVGGWINATDCDHLTVRGCVMRDAGPTAVIARSEQVRLIDNVFSKDRVTGNMWSILECSWVLIEGNSFAHVGHSPIQITTSRNVVVRANCFMNPWGRNYEFWASGRLLVEGNIITRARDSGYSADSRAKNLYLDSIFRYNRVFGNLHTPLNSGSYMPAGARPTSSFREPFRLMNSRIYHNTIAGNLGHGWEINGLAITANEFANNIFARNDWTGANVQFTYGSDVSRDNRVRGNLFRGTEPGQAVIGFRGETMPVQEVDRRTSLLEGFWSEFQDNVDADPAFVDADANDFRLSEGSGAIDAGVPLALAIGEGSGRELPVTDGRPFFDGFGIEGEQGDWIAVGTGDNVARIERVELRYYLPAILHLDREVSWTDGMPVSLPWSGAAPDAGAFERGGSHPSRFIALAQPAYPRPGEPVRFRIDPLGKTVTSVRWDFRDGSVSDEVSPEHTWAEAGDHGVVVRCEFDNGERGVETVFVGVEEPVDPAAPLVQADFEEATRESQWGYHFKFYRSWLTGYEHVARADGAGKCMRLFYGEGKANQAAGAVAPGVWEIDRYPLIRFAYRIAPGTPVGICVEPFEGVPGPRGWIVGGTDTRVIGGYTEVEGPRLIDDDRWHEVTVDLRAIRSATPDVVYLRRFMFLCNWREDQGQQFWFDDFAILPE